MRQLISLGLLLSLFHSSPSLSADACKRHKSENPAYAQSRCQCKNFPKLLQTPPSQFKNLKLAAACDYQIQNILGEPREVGDFFFRGEQMVSGIVRREPSEFIDEFTLRGGKRVPSPANPPVFFRHEVFLQFNDQRLAEKTFKAPKPGEATPCWEAKARLKITEMRSVFGWDNREGDFPLKYEVMELGPYRKCLNPTPVPSGE